MSRYSPTVRPEPGLPLATALMEGFDAFLKSRRQRDQDREATTSREIENEGRGYRSGEPPTDSDSGPATDGSEYLTPLPDKLKTLGTAPVAPAHHGEALADAFTLPENLRSLPALMPEHAPTHGFDELPSIDQGPMPPRHPGAFDPTSRSFARALATTPKTADPSRYTKLPSGGYIDEEATPRAESARDRASQLALAAAFRSNDLGTRGDQAASLERDRQGNRMALRDSINGNALVAIALRSMMAGENQEAHDTRTAATTADHDARVTERKTIPPNGPRSDSPTAEASRMRMATAIIEAAGGGVEGYQAGLDWLHNDPAGQEAAKHGLREDHFYAGLGAWNKHQQDLRVGVDSKNPANDGTDIVGHDRQPGVGKNAPVGGPTGMSGARRMAATREMSDRVAAPDAEAKSAWVKANPPKPGETREQYHARYQASTKPPEE